MKEITPVGVDRAKTVYTVHGALAKVPAPLRAQSRRTSAPRPGLEPGACALTVPRSSSQKKHPNQALRCLFAGSAFEHSMALNAPGRAKVPTCWTPL